MRLGPRARAAAPLALAPLAAVLALACVVPMPIEADPAELNHAPSYEFSLVAPTPARLIDYAPEGPAVAPLEFLLGGLDDPNEDDNLYWRVFLNYQGRYYNAIYRSNRGDGLTPALRAEGVSFQLSPCLDFKLFPFEGPYRVELIVADRPFRQAEDGADLINQILPEGARSFRVHWFVRYERALCPL